MSVAPHSGPHEPERLAQLDRRAPRYTSFPTAAHFTPAVGEAEAGRWLAGLDRVDPVSLYVHLPFCKRLCWGAVRLTGAGQNQPYFHHPRRWPPPTPHWLRRGSGEGLVG